MAARFEIEPTSNAQFRFVLVAGNGEPLLNSETYTTKANALNGIESVRENAQIDTRYERKDAANGQPMFNLRAGNKQVVGTSETYSSNGAREAGIAAVMRLAPAAPVADLT